MKIISLWLLVTACNDGLCRAYTVYEKVNATTCPRLTNTYCKVLNYVIAKLYLAIRGDNDNFY